MCIAFQAAELQRMVGEMVKETNGEDPTSSSKRESAGGNALSKHVDSERPISVDAFTSVVMAHGFNSVTSTAFKEMGAAINTAATMMMAAAAFKKLPMLKKAGA